MFKHSLGGFCFAGFALSRRCKGPAKTTLQHLIVHERKAFAGHDGYVESAGHLDGVSTHSFASLTAYGTLQSESANHIRNHRTYLMHTFKLAIDGTEHGQPSRTLSASYSVSSKGIGLSKVRCS